MPVERARVLTWLGFIAELEAAGVASGGWGEENVSKAGDTILDRLHRAR